MNQSPLSLRYDAANQLYRLYHFHQPTDTDLTRPNDHDTSSSSDDDRPEVLNGGLGLVQSPPPTRARHQSVEVVRLDENRAEGGLSPTSAAAATQRARHQPAEVLRFAAGLTEDAEVLHTRSHWEALVAVAATYCDELSQDSS